MSVYQRCIHNLKLHKRVWWWIVHPSLLRNDWIKEKSEDSDINLIVQLIKSDKLKKYVARKMDSLGIQVLLKYHKDLFLRNGLLYQRVSLKNHQEPISQIVLPKILFGK